MSFVHFPIGLLVFFHYFVGVLYISLHEHVAGYMSIMSSHSVASLLSSVCRDK